MKVIGRTLIILAAALVVVGAAIGFSRSALASQLIPGGRGGDFAGPGFSDGGRSGGPGGDFNGQQPPQGFNQGDFPRGGERRGGSGLNISGLLPLGQYLLTISVIVLVVVLFERLLSRRKRRQKVAE